VFAHADHVDRFAAATGVEPDETFRDGDRVGNTSVRAVETPPGRAGSRRVRGRVEG